MASTAKAGTGLPRPGCRDDPEVVLSKDAARLKKSYSPPAEPGVPDALRLAGPLSLDLADAVALGDAILADLDSEVYGIGWWSAYPSLDRKTRILVSDYLAACARAVPDNLVEARIERLELDHAVDDFRTYLERGIRPGKPLQMKAPRGAYDELAQRRAMTHLAGMLRAWGTVLDCLGGCIVGVAGLPTNLVLADMGTARKKLEKLSPGNPVLKRLQDELDQAETDAGPPGWREWLLGMRNTVVHRGRRIATWSGDVDRTGLVGFSLQLPVSPDLTEVDAITRAGGQIAATFTAPAADLLDRLGQSVGAYTSAVSRILTRLWQKRRDDPTLLAQDPSQWKQAEGIISPVPVFRGYPGIETPRTEITSLDLGLEVYQRLQAAGLTTPDVSELRPDPKVWS